MPSNNEWCYFKLEKEQESTEFKLLKLKLNLISIDKETRV